MTKVCRDSYFLDIVDFGGFPSQLGYPQMERNGNQLYSIFLKVVIFGVFTLSLLSQPPVGRHQGLKVSTVKLQ